MAKETTTKPATATPTLEWGDDLQLGYANYYNAQLAAEKDAVLVGEMKNHFTMPSRRAGEDDQLFYNIELHEPCIARRKGKTVMLDAGEVIAVPEKSTLRTLKDVKPGQLVRIAVLGKEPTPTGFQRWVFSVKLAKGGAS